MTHDAVLVDTSIWIEYFRDSKTPAVDLFDKLLNNDQVTVCPLIFQEVLQGIRDQTEYSQTKELLESLPRLKADVYLAAIGAADIFRSLRQQGITIRKSNDCLIAWYALNAGCPVLHNDRDFDLMAKPLKLKVLR